MKFLSVCSGIEAVSVATASLGWEAVGFSEIEPLPCSVLAERFPHVPNFGNMENFNEWNMPQFDILAGGTPCQSFSIAGLRGGLQDERGNLALVYCRILQKFRPKWFLWENVPGVLSSAGGRDFGSILGAMVELGYGVAYRVLDAQYFGVPQRRRRVFIVGCLGDWTSAAEVLFEQGCIRGIGSKTSTKTVARCLTARGAGSLDDRETFVYDEVGLRHLTPTEWENLQGFPKGWTFVNHRSKPAADGPRYKAIGNSMAVPVIRWICKRIQEKHRCQPTSTPEYPPSSSSSPDSPSTTNARTV